MSYQVIYQGLNKKASAEQVKQLAIMIKQAALQKEALRGTGDLSRFTKTVIKYAPRLARAGKTIADSSVGKRVAEVGSKLKNDLAAAPGQFRSGFNNAPILEDRDPSKMQRTLNGLKTVYSKNKPIRYATNFTAVAAPTLTGASIMKGRGYKQGVKDTTDAAANLIGQQNQALANAGRSALESNDALQNMRKQYKEQVGTGFWEGLWALLKRLFSGEGYAQ